MSKPNRSLYYLGKDNLRNSGAEIEMTPEQQMEWIKCSRDPFYFIEKYVYIISLDDGKIKFSLRDYQRSMLETCMNNRFSIMLLPRQFGKCVSINTMIKVRNKSTGIVEEISMGEFYSRAENKKVKEL